MSDATCTPLVVRNHSMRRSRTTAGGTVLVWSPRTPWSPRYVDADSATVRTTDGPAERRP